MTIQDYPSRVDDPSARKFGTFSYLPPLTKEQVKSQVEYMIAKGWACAVEHVEPPRATDYYWYMWKLPMFGERNADVVLAEVDACKDAHPNDHIRLIGYDAKRQTQGLSLVVHRGTTH
ncbi:MAG: ribulose bisphosphate carboxylase small subunit [Actinomycetota bacterium]|nr:ribulose bisphosphate carboxylase small subunit [Actinomycetota bacterium]